MASYMVADTSLDIIHGSGVQFVETAGLSKPQVHTGDTERPVRRDSGSAMESAYVKNCVGMMIWESASLRCTYLRSRAQPR